MTHKQAVIFDLDGVLVRTDEYHYQSWVRLAGELHVPFRREIFDTRMRGLARMDCLAVFLEPSPVSYSAHSRSALAVRKDTLFRCLFTTSDPGPTVGAIELLEDLRRRGARMAVGSSSRNARWVLEVIGLGDWFDVIVDGSQGRGKPQPDIFLRAAERLSVRPEKCVVLEDAVDGVEAARRAGMAVVAIGPAERFTPLGVPHVASLAELTAEQLLATQAYRSTALTRGDEKKPCCCVRTEGPVA